MDDAKDWLRIAKSNLLLGKSYLKYSGEEVRLEEFCFELQQSVEKSLKAILVKKMIEFPKSHSISVLIALLLENSEVVPEDIVNFAPGLTQYAVETRYPDCYHEITLQEYNKAVEIAEKVYDWAKEIV